uniref:Endo/exonuclease/phosphatase domain-containing protein n=1 Tax=Anopheles dirus TaxID=7168 RepID=A0A182NVP1_9DIPT
MSDITIRNVDSLLGEVEVKEALKGALKKDPSVAHKRILGVTQFEEFLQRVEIVANGHPKIVLAGDFNAWHSAWGSQRSTTKGEELLHLSIDLGLEVLNLGNENTFLGSGVARPSIVDVSFASTSISRPDLDNIAAAERVEDARILAEETRETQSRPAGSRSRASQRLAPAPAPSAPPSAPTPRSNERQPAASMLGRSPRYRGPASAEELLRRRRRQNPRASTLLSPLPASQRHSRQPSSEEVERGLTRRRETEGLRRLRHASRSSSSLTSDEEAAITEAVTSGR